MLEEMLDISRIWWVVVGCAVPAALGAAIGSLKQKYKQKKDAEEEVRKAIEAEREEREENEKIIKDALLSILRDRMTQACEHWILVGYCPTYSRQNLRYMHESYAVLGGNSYMSEMLEKTMALPLGPHEEEEQ